MKNPFRIVMNDTVCEAWFGKIKFLPELDSEGHFQEDAVAYVKGENNTSDVYIPLSEGYQVRAGIEYPEFSDTKLRGGRHMSIGDRVCFVRHRQLMNRAVRWGLTKFYDLSSFAIIERASKPAPTVESSKKNDEAQAVQPPPVLVPQEEERQITECVAEVAETAPTPPTEPTAEEIDDAEARRMLDSLCPAKGMDISANSRRAFTNRGGLRNWR